MKEITERQNEGAWKINGASSILVAGRNFDKWRGRMSRRG